MNKRIAALILIVITGFFGYFSFVQGSAARAANTRVVTVHVDGEERVLATNAATVREVLQSLESPLGEHDKTEPALDAPVVGGEFSINVYRARPISVVDGANSYTVMTAERTPRLIAEEAGFATTQEDEFMFERSDDPFEETPGTELTIRRAKNIAFDLYGTTSNTSTNETTVAEFLRSKNITLEQGDELNVDQATRITEGMLISLAQVQRNVETVEEVAAFSEEQIKDAQQPISYKKIQTPGVNGKKLVTYELVSRNGGAPERIVVKEVITVAPVKQVVVVGDKQFSGSLAQWLSVLRACESGGNYQTNTGNGYYGAYQFSASTWRRIAPKVGRSDLVGIMPHQASPADQDYMIIQNTKLSSGGLATQNPGCYKKHGLAQFPPAE